MKAGDGSLYCKDNHLAIAPHVIAAFIGWEDSWHSDSRAGVIYSQSFPQGLYSQAFRASSIISHVVL